MSRLPHLTQSGEVHIVDIADKPATRRVAIAEGWIFMLPETARLVREQQVQKGDVLAVARIAGLMAAKRTADIVPLCHPVALAHVTVDIAPADDGSGFRCQAEAVTTGPTGVEMEAMHAVQATLLTIYDMCKAMDRGMTLTDIRLVHKRGGRSGTWNRE